MKNKISRVCAIFIFLLFTTAIYPQAFTERTEVTLPGTSSGSASWGDYDNDGDRDLLLAGIEADNTLLLKVFKNNAGLFTEHASAFSPDPNNIASGWGMTFRADWIDFNKDNYLDVITAGPASTGSELSVYSNNSGTSFTKVFSLPYLTFQGGSSFDCGDYDNDGNPDIVLSNSMETKIIRNLGSFNFTKVSSVTLPGLQYSSVKLCDYDSDGDRDILMSGQSNWINKSYLFRNNGFNSFTEQSNSIQKGCIDWGDFDNDGFADILIAGNTGIYKNNGDNTFSNQNNVILPFISNGAGRWGDFDNDGDNDIIITGNSITKIWINNGDGSFTVSSTAFAGLTDSFVSPGDYDSDGDLDIIITGVQGSSAVCKLYRNETSTVNPAPAAPASPVTTITGNDVIMSWNPVASDNTPAASLSYNLIIGTTSGGYDMVNPEASTSSGYFRRSQMGNGMLGNTFVLRNIRKQNYFWKVQAIDNSFRGGAFSAEGSFNYNVSVQAYDLRTSDMGGKECTIEWSRGNGTNCIVFMKEGNSGTVVPVNGTSYTASSVFKSGSQISAWYCVYKGTGTSVRVTGLNANTDYIFQVFEYEGTNAYYSQTGSGNPFAFKTGTFTSINAALQPVANYSLMVSQASSAYWFDSDNDGDLDVMLLGTSAAYFYRKDAGDTYTSLSLPFGGGYSASMGDYDNDGYIDIVLNGNTGIYRNNHNNTFTLQSVTLPQVYYGPVEWSDFDNDGDLDFVISGKLSTQGNITQLYKQNTDGSFTLQELITFDQVAYGSVKSGDYDNDGLNDIVIAGSSNEAVSLTNLYRNNGKDNFIKQTSSNLTGTSSSTINWSDYDKDGDQDLLVGRFGPTTLYRNDGGNKFTPQTGINLSSTGYGSVAWGDYDNDGDPDILLSGFTTDYKPSTRLYKNNGNGTFTEDINSALPAAGYGSAVFGDYDNDNDLDILVEGVDADKSFSRILRNDLVTANVKPSAPLSPQSEVSKSDVTLKWHSVRSDNTYYKSMSYNIMVGTVSGGIDLVTPHSDVTTGFRRLQMPGNGGYDTLFILKNLPFGTYYWKVQAVDNTFAGGLFSAENSFQIVPVQASRLSASIEDRNSLKLKWERGNGDRCVVFCKQTSTGLATPINNTPYIADGEFGYGSQIGSSGWYCVFNGRADSAVITGLVYEKEYSFHVIEYIGSAGSENYFTNVVDGNPGVFTTSLFAKQTGIILPDSFYNPPSWGDYDNDGDPDLLLPGNPTKIFTNNGNNSFTELAAAFPIVYYGSGIWGDYDNDNDLDFVLSGATSSFPASNPVIKLYKNNGAGSFSEQTNPFQAVYNSSLEWYDYNGDGFIDLLLTGATGSDPDFNPVSRIYKNNGNGTFTAQTITLTGVMKGSATWGDYDNDGDPDIILGGVLDYNENHNTLKIYRNDGNNVFTELTQSLPGYPKITISWGDFDNDSDPDLLISTYIFMKVLKNGTNNIFTEYFSAFYSFQDAAGTAWCDYDNDGYLDIISTKPGLNTEIYRNMTAQGGTFRRQDDEAFASTGYRYVSPADYDSDGDIDFVLTRQSGASLIFRNNLIMKSGLFKINGPPPAPLNPRVNYSPNGVILEWDPANDDITPVRTMMYNLSIGTTPGTENIIPSNSSSLTGFRKKTAMGNIFTDTAFLLKKLPAGNYYWNVQAIDQAYKGGAWSSGGTFEVKSVQAFFSVEEVCLGLPTRFTDQSVATSGIVSWNWDFTDGTSSVLRNPSHSFTMSGTYNVKLVVTDASGLKDSIEKAVVVRKKPLTSFTAASVCQGDPVTITNTTNNNGLIIASWKWTFGDGITSSNQQPDPHPYLLPKQYFIKLKATATNGCADSLVTSVTVANYPSAAISANAPLSFCQGDSVVLSVPYNIQYAYNWKLDGTNLTGGDSSRFTAKLSGNYTVEIVNTVAECVSTSLNVKVNVRPAPYDPVIKAVNYTPGVCPGENPVRLSADVESSEYKYVWFKDDSPLLRDTLSYMDIFDAGNYRLVASQNGCAAQSKLFEVSFPDALPKPIVYYQGPTLWYLACSNDSASIYKWYYNGQLINNATGYLYVANQRLGDYMVSIANSKGCFTRSDVVTIPPGYTGTDDTEFPGEINIYPNPTQGFFTITINNQILGEVIISITDLTGKETGEYKFEKNNSSFSVQMNPGRLVKGNYLIFIRMNKIVTVRKIIVE